MHSSGNNSDQTAPPQVQIHSSDGPSAPANGAHDSRDLTLPSSEFPASPWAAATRSGSPTSSPASQHGGGPPSQPVQANGISSQATPPANANNDSLAAPIPLPYGHAGPMLGRLGHPLEGRISPRPVSRNNSRASNRDVSYNVDGHARLPGDNRMQLFVGNVSDRSIRSFPKGEALMILNCMFFFPSAAFSSSMAGSERPLSQVR